jgi:transcriptional regulator with XRE-family HTH domain
MKKRDHKKLKQLMSQLRQRREYLQLPQAAVARAAGINSAEHYGMMEAGRRLPRLHHLPGMATGLGLDVRAFCCTWLQALEPQLYTALACNASRVKLAKDGATTTLGGCLVVTDAASLESSG